MKSLTQIDYQTAYKILDKQYLYYEDTDGMIYSVTSEYWITYCRVNDLPVFRVDR